MKIIWSLAGWTCFYLGHWWSRIIMRPLWMQWTYPVYNTLMIWSYELDEKYGLGIWVEEDAPDSSGQ